jgi:hypothetical protein
MNHTSIPIRRATWALLVAGTLALPATAQTQLSIEVAVPGVSLGIVTGGYPSFARVPDVPVYYAPRGELNLFFYDGLYWVYQRDNWYASSWYDGPWRRVRSDGVPLFVLRVPVRYYRSPPSYFRGWQADAPPRWGDYWGDDWARQHSGWDRWDRRRIPAPAPLPTYQRSYSGDRYPAPDRQKTLQDRNYRYQPRDAVVQQQRAAQRPAVVPDKDDRNRKDREPKDRDAKDRDPKERQPKDREEDRGEGRKQDNERGNSQKK